MKRTKSINEFTRRHLSCSQDMGRFREAAGKQINPGINGNLGEMGKYDRDTLAAACSLP